MHSTLLSCFHFFITHINYWNMTVCINQVECRFIRGETLSCSCLYPSFWQGASSLINNHMNICLISIHSIFYYNIDFKPPIYLFSFLFPTELIFYPLPFSWFVSGKCQLQAMFPCSQWVRNGHVTSLSQWDLMKDLVETLKKAPHHFL